MNKKLTISLILGILSLNLCFARVQNYQDLRESKDDLNDIEFSAGLITALGSSASNGEVIRLTYSHYYYNNMGYKVGLQFANDFMNTKLLATPISFSYKTKDFTKRFEKAWNNSFGEHPHNTNNQFVDRHSSFSSDFMNFFLNLLSGTEFFIGLTPGYILKNDNSSYEIIKDDFYSRSFTKVNYKPYLSADLGVSLNFRIWRINLKMTPAIHYIITNTYIEGHKSINKVAQGLETRTTFKNINWQFTFCGGLSYMF